VNKNWYVLYTKTTQEKEVRDLLVKNGYEVFFADAKGQASMDRPETVIGCRLPVDVNY
jgi:hypothetical protein